MSKLAVEQDPEVVVFPTRQIEGFSRLLRERFSSISVRATSFPPPERSLVGWINDIASGEYDDVLFSSAHGIRLACEYAAELGSAGAFLNGLRSARLIALGRRTMAALVEAGLEPELTCAEPDRTALDELFRRTPFSGHVVGLQSTADEAVVIRGLFEAAGARVCTLAPSLTDDPGGPLLAMLLERPVDVVVFGASSQVASLLSAAEASGQLGQISAILGRAVILAPESAHPLLRERGYEPRPVPLRPNSHEVNELLASVAGGAAKAMSPVTARATRRLVVVGHGMVGHRFCERLLEDAGDAFEITVLAEEPRPAYDRVHLTRYLETKNADSIALATADWYAEKGIRLVLGERAVCINREPRFVVGSSGKAYPYEVLVLATGSAPFVPSVPGVDKAGVFVYRTVEDLDKIAAYASEARVAAVIGGGLLGLEAAKALLDLGLGVDVVECAPRLMPRQLDEPAAALLARKVRELGVRVHLGKGLARITGEVSATGLRFEDGTSLEADLVVISAGIRPRDELARGAGLRIGERGGVLVDDALCTSDPNIFAIGECALHRGLTYGLVAPGYEMADVVARLLSGGEATFGGASLSAKLKLLGVDVASFGDPFGEPATTRTVVFEDHVRDVYKKVVLDESGTCVKGGILVGDASQYGVLAHLAKSGSALQGPPEALLLGGSPSLGGAELAVPICSCNNVSRSTICEAIRRSELRTVGAVKAATKAGTGCGGCLPEVADLLAAELAAAGCAVKPRLCEHFEYTRTELFEIISAKRLRSFERLLAEHGSGNGCEICKPAVASILASLYNESILNHDTLQDTNDRFLANLQRGGLYSVVPRVAGGEITPEKLIALGQVAARYGLYTKITGGQRIDLFGARVNDLPDIWRELVQAGFESGHAYGKAMRTVKSCVGSTWCRYGVQDSVAFAIRVENRYKGVRAPHKMKAAVSGCVRECAEAQSKDFGLIATEKGWNLYVCGNGGMKPRHADLLASDLDEDTAIRYVDRFIMFYIRTADRLTRTSVWLEKMEGGIEHLRDVIVRDSLGICSQLETDMQGLVDTYRCEWAEVVNDEKKRAKFRQFANSEGADDSIEFVEERGQKRPADWPRSLTVPEPPPREERNWVRVAPVETFPKDGGMAVTCGHRQIAVFHFASRGQWHAVDNRCPHKGDNVLARGILGDQDGVPKVACPLHKKTFSLEDGRCLSDPGYSVGTYAVRVTGGWVEVEVPPKAMPDVPVTRLSRKNGAPASSSCAGGE